MRGTITWWSALATLLFWPPLAAGLSLWASSVSVSTSTATNVGTELSQIQRYQQALRPPFCDGPCGGTVHRIPAPGNLRMLLPQRSVDVWLPPDYRYTYSSLTTNRGDSAQQKKRRQHPVLYCHDGQNVMSDHSSWTGASWRLIGALARLADLGLLRRNVTTPIVVMIPSANGDWIPGIRRRHLEYGEGPFADAHAEWVAKTIVPMIDGKFSTNPNERYAMGSSLGGQASMQLVLRYPDLFHGAACLSPYFQPSTVAAVRKMASAANTSNNQLQSKRFYIDIGGDMGEAKVPLFDVQDHLTPEHWWNPGYWWLDSQLQPGVTAMREALQTQQLLRYHEEPGGRHNERAWAQRVHLPLLFLFGKEEKLRP